MQARKKFAVMTLLLVSVAHATTWYVHPDSALNSIQAGLDSCFTDDTVLVAPSTYYENITWPDVQGIKLLSESGAGTTIIDGNSDTNVIYINVAVDSTTVIHGFTIQNGTTGVYCNGGYVDHCCPKIANNVIGNSDIGIICDKSSPIITYNRIINNTIEGIFCFVCSLAVISNNYISFSSIGITCDYSTPYIIDDTITFNMGGIGCWNSSPTISGTVVIENTGDGIELFDSHSTISLCTISNNGDRGIYINDIYVESPHINHNNITNNFGYGILYADSQVVIDAENNWWGDASGPGGVGPGIGDEVSAYVDYEPWLTNPVGIEEHGFPKGPKSSLQINPNPFRDKVSIKFDSRYDAQTTEIKIYDISGRLIKRFDQLTNNESPNDQISWDGTDNSGNQEPRGIYFLRFYVDDFKETHKLILMR